MGGAGEVVYSLPKVARRDRHATASMLIFLLFTGVSILWFTLSWFIGIVTVSGVKWYGPVPLEAKAQLRAIQRRLWKGEDRAMGRVFPEGLLFSNSFYGFCLVNMALAEPKNRQFTQEALREIERLLPKVEGFVEEEPFSSCRGISPIGGIILRIC